MPRKNRNAGRQSSGYRGTWVETVSVSHEHSRPVPTNSVGIATVAKSRFTNDTSTAAELKKITRTALDIWARPSSIREAATFEMSGKLEGFRFYSQRTRMTGSGLLVFSVACQVSDVDRFSPLPQQAAELADRFLYDAVGGDLELLTALEQPIPFGLQIVTRTDDNSWARSYNTPATRPLETRLFSYDFQTLSDYSASLPTGSSVERY